MGILDLLLTSYFVMVFVLIRNAIDFFSQNINQVRKKMVSNLVSLPAFYFKKYVRIKNCFESAHFYAKTTVPSVVLA